MFKVITVVGFLLTVHLICDTTSRSIETLSDDDSIEIPPKTNRQGSNNGFSVFRPADDAIFNLINKLVNTTYLSSKMALNRVRSQSEARKKIEDDIENFLESLPNFPIPVLDDFSARMSGSKNDKSSLIN